MAKGKNFGLYFDGRTQIGIGSAEELKLTNSSFTVDVWVKVDRYIPSNSNRDTAIIGINERNGEPSSIFHLTMRNKRPYMGFFHNDTPGKQVIEERIWYHLAFVYNKRTRQQIIYVNGKLDTDSKIRFPNNTKGKGPMTGTGQVVMGNCMALNSYMLGFMRGLRIWDSALPEERIRYSMNADVIEDQPGLTAYWTFEDGFVNKALKGEATGEETSQLNELKNKLEELNAANRELLIALEKENKEKEELYKLLEEREFEMSRLSEKVQRELTDQSGVTIATLIEDANNQISKARGLLKESDYNLGHVNLQFKMIPNETGSGVIFPSTEQIADSAGALSTIDIEFAPKEATKVVEKPTKEVPDVKGLTEVMARRKIAQLGFMTEVKYKAVEDRKDKDRVVIQDPDPNNSPLAEINTTILIFIGKEIM